MRLAARLIAASAMVVLSVLIGSAQTASPTAQIAVHLFWQNGCPHCANARDFLAPEIADSPRLELRLYEVSEDEAARALFLAVLERFEVTRPAVPIIIVGEEIFIGYGGPEATGRAVLRAAHGCRLHACADVVAALAAQAAAPDADIAADDNAAGATGAKTATRPAGLPPVITLPFFGAIETGALSLPMLTVLLGAVDGFNPCAMWVLVFLIGLLHGMRDRLRKWLLGATFLAVSAGVYYAFMAAWLNMFLLIGALFWVRITIGAVAIASGGWYLREVITNPEGVCHVSDLEGRQRIMGRLRNAVTERGLWLGMLGVAVIAIGVNLVELLCSAGLPAIYTQVLAMSDLPAWAYYAYLALYILIFLLDDLVVFATAMLTLEAANATASYARWSHLIGGALLLAIGVALILKPEWLTLG